jgi:hypothetical protein
MQTLYIVLILACLLCVYKSTKKENFTELFGFAGYKKPITNIDINYTSSGYDISKFQETTDGVTRDEINDCLKISEKFIRNRQSDLCVYPIETNKIMKYTGANDSIMFRCRFMYTVTNQNFPFGFGASVDILNGSVVAFHTQTKTPNNSIGPSEKMTGADFLPIADIMPKPNMYK